MRFDAEQFLGRVPRTAAALLAAGSLLLAACGGEPNTSSITIQNSTVDANGNIPPGAIDAVSNRLFYANPGYQSRIAAMCGGLNSWVQVVHFNLFSPHFVRDLILTEKDCATTLGVRPTSTSASYKGARANTTFPDSAINPNQLVLSGPDKDRAVQHIDDKCNIRSAAPVLDDKSNVGGYLFVVGNPACLALIGYELPYVPSASPAATR